MSFIRVTASQCNQQGLTSQHVPPSELHLNLDLVGAIRGNEVLLKGGDIIILGGNYYTKFRLADGVKIPTV